MLGTQLIHEAKVPDWKLATKGAGKSRVLNIQLLASHEGWHLWNFLQISEEVRPDRQKEGPGSSLAVQWLRIRLPGLPWWRSGWESACQCRGHGFEPWSGKIPHAVEQLGPWATITEPARLEPVLCNKRGHDSERPTHRDEEWPPLATTRESPRTETKTQHSQK